MQFKYQNLILKLKTTLAKQNPHLFEILNRKTTTQWICDHSQADNKQEKLEKKGWWQGWRALESYFVH